jgi:hypothetical protein
MSIVMSDRVLSWVKVLGAFATALGIKLVGNEGEPIDVNQWSENITAAFMVLYGAVNAVRIEKFKRGK